MTQAATDPQQVMEAIAAVASTVRCGDDGQGVFYNAAERTVFWSGGDSDFSQEFLGACWEEVEQQLLAIEGVDSVELEAEVTPWDLYEDRNHWEGEPGPEDSAWVVVRYERNDDVIAWQRWVAIEVMRLPPNIVDRTWRECGLPVLPYPADCPPPTPSS